MVYELIITKLIISSKLIKLILINSINSLNISSLLHKTQHWTQYEISGLKEQKHFRDVININKKKNTYYYW